MCNGGYLITEINKKIYNQIMSDKLIQFDGPHVKLIQQIKENEGIVVLIFYSTWCIHCTRLLAALPELMVDFPNATFIKSI